MPLDLRHRRRQPEIIDEPGLDTARARGGAARPGDDQLVERQRPHPVAQCARPGPRIAPRRLRVLDIATGGGDVPIRLWRKARRAGLDLDVHGCDVSPTAVAYARQQADAAGADVTFFEADALTAALPEDFDVLTSSLFLHHLDEEQALRALAGDGPRRREPWSWSMICAAAGSAMPWRISARVCCRARPSCTRTVPSPSKARSPAPKH